MSLCHVHLLQMLYDATQWPLLVVDICCREELHLLVNSVGCYYVPGHHHHHHYNNMLNIPGLDTKNNLVRFWLK